MSPHIEPLNAPISSSHSTGAPMGGYTPGKLRFSSFGMTERFSLIFAAMMLFITLIISTNAMGQVGDLNKVLAVGLAQAAMSSAHGTCSHEALRGTRVLTSPGGRHYQIVGKQLNKDSGYSWFEAQADAEQRCYNGCRGTLATIPTKAENEFLHQQLCQRMDCMNYGFQGINQAWIGATDMRVEGTWEWGAPEAQPWDANPRRVPFWRTTGIEGGAGTAIGYAHWRAGEPNNNPASESSEEDCAQMDGDLTQSWNGTWNDDHCYTRKSWWIVDLSFRCEHN
jgi:hypothetical protein